eukprot:1182710-Prorocentrum_minimum.AAC.2
MPSGLRGTNSRTRGELRGAGGELRGAARLAHEAVGVQQGAVNEAALVVPQVLRNGLAGSLNEALHRLERRLQAFPSLRVVLPPRTDTVMAPRIVLLTPSHPCSM